MSREAVLLQWERKIEVAERLEDDSARARRAGPRCARPRRCRDRGRFERAAEPATEPAPEPVTEHAAPAPEPVAERRTVTITGQPTPPRRRRAVVDAQLGQPDRSPSGRSCSACSWWPSPPAPRTPRHLLRTPLRSAPGRRVLACSACLCRVYLLAVSQRAESEAAMKTKESRFQVHDELTAPERSVPILKGALSGGGQLPNFIGVLAGSPAVLRAYARFRSELRHGSLPYATQQRIALAVAEHQGSEYALADAPAHRARRRPRPRRDRAGARVRLARRARGGRCCAS